MAVTEDGAMIDRKMPTGPVGGCKSFLNDK